KTARGDIQREIADGDGVTKVFFQVATGDGEIRHEGVRVHPAKKSARGKARKQSVETGPAGRPARSRRSRSHPRSVSPGWEIQWVPGGVSSGALSSPPETPSLHR